MQGGQGHAFMSLDPGNRVFALVRFSQCYVALVVVARHDPDGRGRTRGEDLAQKVNAGRGLRPVGGRSVGFM